MYLVPPIANMHTDRHIALHNGSQAGHLQLADPGVLRQDCDDIVWACGSRVDGSPAAQVLSSDDGDVHDPDVVLFVPKAHERLQTEVDCKADVDQKVGIEQQACTREAELMASCTRLVPRPDVRIVLLLADAVMCCWCRLSLTLDAGPQERHLIRCDQRCEYQLEAHPHVPVLHLTTITRQ